MVEGAAVELVGVRRDDGWAEVTLNRPDRRNAITRELAEALARTLSDLDDDEDVRAILLCGAGGAFCSGMDLDALRPAAGAAPDHAREPASAWSDVHAVLLARRTPVVVALERFAINAGAALVLSADLVVAGRDAFMQVSEVAMGIAAPMCQAWFHLRHPAGVARRMVLLGERVHATELVAPGVVAEVTEPENVLGRAREICATLAGHPAIGLAAVQRVRATLDDWPIDRAAAAAELDRVMAAGRAVRATDEAAVT